MEADSFFKIFNGLGDVSHISQDNPEILIDLIIIRVIFFQAKINFDGLTKISCACQAHGIIFSCELIFRLNLEGFPVIPLGIFPLLDKVQHPSRAQKSVKIARIVLQDQVKGFQCLFHPAQ